MLTVMSVFTRQPRIDITFFDCVHGQFGVQSIGLSTDIEPLQTALKRMRAGGGGEDAGAMAMRPSRPGRGDRCNGSRRVPRRIALVSVSGVAVNLRRYSSRRASELQSPSFAPRCSSSTPSAFPGR